MKLSRFREHLSTKKIAAVLVVAAIAVIVAIFFMNQINDMVSSTTYSYMTELAEHDLQTVTSFLNIQWDDLENISSKLNQSRYTYNSIYDLQERMHSECSYRSWYSLYLLADDGRLYSDDGMIYAPSEHDMGNMFPNGERRIVTRYDEENAIPGQSRECLLYGVSLDHGEISGVRFVALFGTTNKQAIHDNIKIDSFEGRGYSTIIDMDGNYIIDMEDILGTDAQESFIYGRLKNGTIYNGVTYTDVLDQIARGESFNLVYTPVGDERKIVVFLPIPDTEWYFFIAVPSSVFDDQSKSFIYLTFIILLCLLLLIGFLLAMIYASSKKTMKAVSDAQARSEFLSNMSHEIRTPLNGLVGINYLMKKNLNNPQKMEDLIDKSSHTANYLLYLVDDILDLSKLQAGKVTLNCQPMSWEVLLDEIWSMQLDNIRSHGVQFIIQKNILFPFVLGDDLRIKQIFMNIVGNAAKFTPEGGKITLTLSQERRDENHATTTIIIADTGIGMSEEFLGKIFDSFSQERNRNNNSVKGTGLGMAITSLLVQAMGGEISVKSKLNEGSTFTVVLTNEITDQLPAYMEHSGESDTAKIPVGKSGRPLNILLAEDNELNAEILIEILQDEGFGVSHARNGREAVSLFTKSQVGEFDVILMDMQMPEMNGCEAATAIRRLDRPDAAEVTIFACTANTFKEDHDKAIASGMNDFLSKPVNVKNMLQKLGMAGGGVMKQGSR